MPTLTVIPNLKAVGDFVGAELDPSDWIEHLFGGERLAFDVTLVTNASDESLDVVSRHKEIGQREGTATPLGLAWPTDIYSLSHIAPPIPPDDPLYGGPDAGPSPGIQLGNLALRGERGALRVAASDLLRLRWNPFYAYLEERVLAFVR